MRGGVGEHRGNDAPKSVSTSSLACQVLRSGKSSEDTKWFEVHMFPLEYVSIMICSSRPAMEQHI